MHYRIDTKIIDALLGENGNDDAIFSAVEGQEAYDAARKVIEGLMENEEVNGPGTYGTWGAAVDAIDVYGLGDEFTALPEEQRDAAIPLIESGVARAMLILRDYGHLGGKALLLADELERLNDVDFETKARAEIAAMLAAAAKEAAYREGSAWADFGDCNANEGMSVHVNGIKLGFEYRMPQDWVSSLAREGLDEDEWEALSDVERDELEHDALIAQIQAARDEGSDVGEMWEQVEPYVAGLRSSLESELSYLRHLHDEEARQAA